MSKKTQTIPKISVIIPVYNSERFLRQCLDSVLFQPLEDIEIICVNDGSTDGSASILDEYAEKDKRIKIIHKENQGAGIARNTGLDIAIGEYLHFLDSDDYLVDNVYENIYNIARKNELDYLCLKAHLIDFFTNNILDDTNADRLSLSFMRKQNYEKPFSIESAPEILTGQMLPPWSGLYRRRFLLTHNIRFPTFASSEDHPFYFAVISHAKRIMAANIYVVGYRTSNPASLTGIYAKSPENQIKAFHIISEYCRFLPKHTYAMIIEHQLRSIMSLYNRSLSSEHIREHTQNLMRRFVHELDLSQAAYVCKKEPWYSDYLILKLELGCEAGTLTPPDKEQLLVELEKSLRLTIPLPLDKIPHNSKVILYGAGFYGKRTYKLFNLSNFCKIVLWTDRDWKKYKMENLPVSNPTDIINIQYDCILIAVENPIVATEIKDNLIKIDVPIEKIILNAD